MRTRQHNIKYIGLVGKAGSGKDLAYTLLSDRMLANRQIAARMAFADPIRGMLCALATSLDIPQKYLSDRTLKETPIPGIGVSYRHLAQTLGTEWGRCTLGNNFWRNAMQMRLERMLSRFPFPDTVVFTDVRFANEAEWVRSLGGVLWRIHRPTASPVQAHVSEDMDFTCDRMVRNTGTVEDFADELAYAYAAIPDDLADIAITRKSL